ncbi:MAG: ProQ/FINO family protein [Pseudomonadota bacterium]
MLEQLAGLYPRLFGAVAVPLKRGVFQDLLDAHPEVFERDGLKAALGLHTRSTRYLQGVATGQQRCDLQGQPVEALAPDHIYHALVELWRRREGRTPEAERAALRDHWRSRIARAFEASGLERTAYAERMRNRDEVAGVMLDEALAEAAGHAARDEALLRAFEASGGTVETFADTYGLDPRVAGRTLDHARRRRAIAQQQPETPAA